MFGVGVGGLGARRPGVRGRGGGGGALWRRGGAPPPARGWLAFLRFKIDAGGEKEPWLRAVFTCVKNSASRNNGGQRNLQNIDRKITATLLAMIIPSIGYLMQLYIMQLYYVCSKLITACRELK